MSSESESKDTSSEQNVSDRIDNVNERIDKVNDRIDTLKTDVVDVKTTLQTNQLEINAKLDMMIKMLQRSFEDNDKNKKDVQTSFVHLDEKIEAVNEDVQQTKSELWRNITEQNVRVDEVVNVVDAIQAAQERQYNMIVPSREQVQHPPDLSVVKGYVQPRLVNLEYEERLIQCMMDTSFTLLCTDIEPEVDDEEVNYTDLEADILMDELVLELQHISDEFNAMVADDTVPVVTLKVYPEAISTCTKVMHAMKAIYLSTCWVLVLSVSLPCVVLPGVGLQGGVALLRGDIVLVARRVFDPGGLAEWL